MLTLLPPASTLDLREGPPPLKFVLFSVFCRLFLPSLVVASSPSLPLLVKYGRLALLLLLVLLQPRSSKKYSSSAVLSTRLHLAVHFCSRRFCSRANNASPPPPLLMLLVMLVVLSLPFFLFFFFSVKSSRLCLRCPSLLGSNVRLFGSFRPESLALDLPGARVSFPGYGRSLPLSRMLQPLLLLAIPLQLPSSHLLCSYSVCYLADLASASLQIRRPLLQLLTLLLGISDPLGRNPEPRQCAPEWRLRTSAG